MPKINKKSMALLILCIFIFVSISSVFASEMDNNTCIGDADFNEALEIGDSPTKDVMSENGSCDGNTFNDLNKDLENLKPGKTISLDKDYVFNHTSDAGNRIINIAANHIEIDGKGHTIDGGGENGAILRITGEAVIIKNLCFTNFNAANSEDMTSSIQWLGDGGFCSNCTFHDNIGIDGGAIYWSGELGDIYQCCFENNIALSRGGAILISGENNVIRQSTFRNFTSSLANEAIYCSRKDGSRSTLNIIQNTFENKGTELGVTKFLYDNECKIMKNGVDITENSFIEILNDLNNLKSGEYYTIDKDYKIINTNKNVLWDRIINITADNVTIDGNGHEIDDGGSLNYLGEAYFYGLFNITGKNVKIVNLTLTGFDARNLEYSTSRMNIYGDDYPRLTSPIEWHGDNGIISNCNFALNSGETGGAINWLGNYGMIENCTFDSNAAGFGGSICMRGTNNIIKNSKFKESYTSNHYEAIYLVKDNEGNPSTLLVKNCTFASELICARDVVLENGCTVTFEDKHENDFPIVPFTELSYYLSILNDNSVYNITQNYNFDAIDTAVIRANNVTINGNGYKIYGDFAKDNAITILGDNVTIINLVFELKQQNKVGSSIISWCGNNGILANSSFVGNRAEMGAAVTWSGNNGTLTDCGFIGNAANVGGALYWKGNNGFINNCVFLNNTATFAGALFISGTNNTINSTLFANSGGAVSNEAIYFDRNRKSLTMVNLAFTQGTMPFLDGHYINIGFDQLFDTFGYQTVADETIDICPLIYATILDGGVQYYKDDVAYYSTYYNESGDFVFTIVKEFPQYDVSYLKQFCFKNVFNNNFDEVYDALNFGNYENKFALSKTLYIDGKSASGDAFSSDAYKQDYCEALNIANGGKKESDDCVFGPVWDMLNYDKARSILAEDYLTEVLNIEFTKACTIDYDSGFDMEDSKFTVINVNGSGSLIRGSYKDRDEDKWAEVCPDKIFIASNIRLAGFNTAVENMGGQCMFNNVDFDHNKMDYWIDRDWGAAILNTGLITCVNCSFTNNYAKNGGAIFNQGILILENCIFANNIAYGSGDHICVGNGGKVIIDGQNITSNTNLVYFPKSMSLEKATLLSSILTGVCFALGVIAGIASIFIPGTSAFAVVGISALVSAGIGAIGAGYIIAHTYDVNYNRLQTALTLIIGCAAAGAMGALTGISIGSSISHALSPAYPVHVNWVKVIGVTGLEAILSSGVIGISYYFTHD